jgi:hypothetical protein
MDPHTDAVILSEAKELWAKRVISRHRTARAGGVLVPRNDVGIYPGQGRNATRPSNLHNRVSFARRGTANPAWTTDYQCSARYDA